MMITPCSKATAIRPKASPIRIVRTGVGVESMRRDKPSCRVSINATDPVNDVRNTKSSN